MDCVSTGHFVRCTTRTKEELLANRAVGLIFATLAVVVRVQALINAHPAVMAVLKVLRASYTTEAAVVTMVWLFVIGHPQITYIAVVCSKLNSTIDTIIAIDKRQARKHKPKATRNSQPVSIQ